MKRLLSLALFAAAALVSAAGPLLASTFGLCYDRCCNCKCGPVVRQPNAFSPYPCYACYDCGNSDWAFCGGGCCSGGCCAGGCCGKRSCKDSCLDRWAIHRIAKINCPAVYGWGTYNYGGGYGYEGVIDGGMVPAAPTLVEAPVAAPAAPAKPKEPTLKEPPISPLPLPKPGPAVSGYYPAPAPQAGMQPVAYQYGYPGYAAYPMGYAPAPAWGYYPAPAYYPQAGYYQQPYYPSPAPSYWNPMGR